jgi:hypothetical protein
VDVDTGGSGLQAVVWVCVWGGGVGFIRYGLPGVLPHVEAVRVVAKRAHALQVEQNF